MSVVKNEKYVMTNDMANFCFVGEEFVVTYVCDEFISLGFKDYNECPVIAVSIDELNTYFKKKDELSGWTKWTEIKDADGNIKAFYRTNHKKVEVKLLDGTKGVATCHGDVFNLYFGIRLAYKRCVNKQLKKKVASLCDNLEEIKNDYFECNSNIERTCIEISNNNSSIENLLKTLL